MNLKETVKNFWNESSCGENLLLNNVDKAGYAEHAEKRYRLEPFILDFAQFSQYQGKRVLELGVGLGSDHQKFAEGGALLSGIDLTERAVAHGRRRLSLFELKSDITIGDVEKLEFADNSFDLVYSWGVIHHSPDTQVAVNEILRVLKPGGEAKIMIYNKWSIVGCMLWLRYGLCALRPLTSLSKLYSEKLESIGTKAYNFSEARDLFSEFTKVNIKTVLTHADLLTSNAGQRHEGLLINLVRKIWPRILIKTFLKKMGLFMLIDVIK